MATGEVTELLQQLIRNGCVNDGGEASGHETRSSDVLRSYLEGTGLDLEAYEPRPGRSSLVARIEGTDPQAPSLMLMGHTDVVPVTEERWRRDPFGGELVDGEVWGRGAVDMLDLTSSMAVAFSRLARSGWRPRGTLIYLAVADEEALGAWGADWLCTHQLDAVRSDYVVTEPGGTRIAGRDGWRLPVVTGEKGTYWVRLRVAGTPGHGSQPWHTDNALVTAAQVVSRIASYQPATQIHDAWRRFVDGADWDPDVKAALVDPARLEAALGQLPLGTARMVHACTHTTFSPNVVQGGKKTNVIPDEVVLDVDIRTLPGQQGTDIQAMLDEALGDLRPRVTVELVADDPSTASPLDTPLWDSLARVTAGLVPGSALIPTMTAGATDARFFRRIGATSYGFGLLSEKIGFEQYMGMFHGDDERVDVESLRLCADLYEALARDLLS
ncbi:M20/M25/M40 family metallo-hydrolase [Acidiferrimicrobium sp. IK]|nr:M20/M25/M40 family metallo-hydrolase [Acidiferrimicrobium sp. IK]